MERKYIYYVFYVAQGCTGSVSIKINNKIESMDQIKDVKKWIEENCGVKNVTLQNWVRLKK